MSAKIKTHRHKHSYKHPYRPKGVSIRHFERVYWPYLPLILLISGLLFFGFGRGGLQNSLLHPSGRVLAYATSMEPIKLLDQTNSQRLVNSDRPLTLNNKLESAAQAKANDMVNRNYWSHYTPDHNPPWVFVTAQDYSYSQLGENLAAGFANESAVVNAWLLSPEHRQNLLNPAFSNVGFGIARSANYSSAGGGPMTIVVAFYGQPATNDIVAGTSPAATTPIAPASATTHAQLAFAPLSSSTAELVIWTIMVAALGVWIGKHVRHMRRSLACGERYVVTHPMLDVMLVAVVIIAYLMTRTAGHIF